MRNEKLKAASSVPGTSDNKWILIAREEAR